MSEMDEEELFAAGEEEEEEWEDYEDEEDT
jgi:hypothetical protein